MTETSADISKILLECEAKQDAPSYKYSDDPMFSRDKFDSQGPLVELSSEGRDVYVISDLHLATGVGDDGRYLGSENFFYDASLHRFLLYAREKSGAATLIINGDFVDFLRVSCVPGIRHRLTRRERFAKNARLSRRRNRIKKLSGKGLHTFMTEFEAWSAILREVGIEKTPAELVSSIIDKEEVYGLKTNDYKSVFRLHAVVEGHPEFFDAIAEWLQGGGRLVIVKGNHDLEWYWLAVRNCLRLCLAKRVARMRRARGQATGEKKEDCGDVRSALMEIVLPHITFIDHAALIDKDFYIEHGHPYDPLTRVIGANTVNDGQELNIPLGSFFNRYLINFLELQYPYLAKVRPTQNILPLMLKNRFLTGLRLLAGHLIVIFRTAPRQYISYIFGQNLIWRALAMFAIVIGGPALLIWRQSTINEPAIIRIVEWVAMLVAAYAAIQCLTYAQLSEPDSLAAFARRQFERHPNYRLITYGHTHNPDQFRRGEQWFYNTGTWIPIVETSAINVRTERTFTFLHIESRDGRLHPGVLMRWDDQARRADTLVVMKGTDS